MRHSLIFPLQNWNRKIPTNDEPGSFGYRRKFDIHTGIDLYVDEDLSSRQVSSICDGNIVAIVDFTGENAESPWWNNTKAILIETENSVICYGEIDPNPNLKVGSKVKCGENIGIVIPVLKESKIRNDIPGHSRFMLHLELYTMGTKEPVWWKSDQEKPDNLLDPTNFIKQLSRK